MYAWRRVLENGDTFGGAAVMPVMIEGQEITNNQVEMIALLKGLEHLPADYRGQICSTNQVTLDRVFHGARWSNIPTLMHEQYKFHRSRLVHWAQIQPVRVVTTDEHIQWCKAESKEAADAYLTRIGESVSLFTVDIMD